MRSEDLTLQAYKQKFGALVSSAWYDLDSDNYVVVFQRGKGGRQLPMEVTDSEALGRLDALTVERVAELLDELERGDVYAA
jgi:hypothetical protein